MRVGSFIVLIVSFSLILNGTTIGQVAWICLSILGQLNTLVAQKLISVISLARLEPIYENRPTPTRTDVYGLIIRGCGGCRWVDETDFLSRTDEWREWSEMD
jgi:hypothetical protein